MEISPKGHSLRSSVLLSAKMIERRDYKKLLAIVFIQFFLGLLDLVGVVVIGGLGALSVQGIEAHKAGTKVTQLLRLFHLEHQDLRIQALMLGSFGAAIFIIKTILSVYFTRKTFYFLANKGAQISESLFAKMLSQDYTKITMRSQQEIVFIISDGVKNILVGIVATFVNTAADFSTLVILSISLFIVDPVVALASLCVFSFASYLLYRNLENRARSIGLEINELTVQSNSKVVEALSAYRELVVQNRRGFYSEQIGSLRRQLGSIIAEMNFQPYISKYAIEAVSVIGILVVAAFEFSTKNAVHAIATLAIFLVASSRIAPAALRIQQSFMSIRNSSGSAEATFKALDELKEVQADSALRATPDFVYTNFIPQIDVNSVSFKYPDSKIFALENMSLSIRPGSRVAIVGPSGAGKTTLLDLILGILEPENGEILLSGLQPRNAFKTWPGSVSYVPQRTFISSGTIRENVAFGYSDEVATDQKVWKALELADMKETVSKFPKQLDTFVGENGINLSGGQRQRIGIARALFTSPRFLVMDEATSSLDGQSELNISEAISELSKNITVLIVAHRLVTVQNVEQLIYIEDGKVRATGSFAQVREMVPNFDQQADLMGL